MKDLSTFHGLKIICLDDIFLFIYLLFLFWLCWIFVAVRGLSLVAVCGLLVVMTSLVAEHGLWVSRFQ